MGGGKKIWSLRPRSQSHSFAPLVERMIKLSVCGPDRIHGYEHVRAFGWPPLGLSARGSHKRKVRLAESQSVAHLPRSSDTRHRNCRTTLPPTRCRSLRMRDY